MGDRALRAFAVIGAGLVALTAAGSLWWHPQAARGILAGGAWNLANLWCLARAMTVWLGPRPSGRRAAWWVIVKFPVLYGVAVGLLFAPGVSLAGFGLGFSVVLACAIVAGIAWSQRGLLTLPTHGG